MRHFKKKSFKKIPSEGPGENVSPGPAVSIDGPGHYDTNTRQQDVSSQCNVSVRQASFLLGWVTAARKLETTSVYTNHPWQVD